MESPFQILGWDDEPNIPRLLVSSCLMLLELTVRAGVACRIAVNDAEQKQQELGSTRTAPRADYGEAA